MVNPPSEKLSDLEHVITEGKKMTHKSPKPPSMNNYLFSKRISSSIVVFFVALYVAVGCDSAEPKPPVDNDPIVTLNSSDLTFPEDPNKGYHAVDVTDKVKNGNLDELTLLSDGVIKDISLRGDSAFITPYPDSSGPYEVLARSGERTHEVSAEVVPQTDLRSGQVLLHSLSPDGLTREINPTKAYMAFFDKSGNLLFDQTTDDEGRFESRQFDPNGPFLKDNYIVQVHAGERVNSSEDLESFIRTLHFTATNGQDFGLERIGVADFMPDATREYARTSVCGLDLVPERENPVCNSSSFDFQDYKAIVIPRTNPATVDGQPDGPSRGTLTQEEQQAFIEHAQNPRGIPGVINGTLPPQIITEDIEGLFERTNGIIGLEPKKGYYFVVRDTLLNGYGYNNGWDVDRDGKIDAGVLMLAGNHDRIEPMLGTLTHEAGHAFGKYSHPDERLVRPDDTIMDTVFPIPSEIGRVDIYAGMVNNIDDDIIIYAAPPLGSQQSLLETEELMGLKYLDGF